MTQLDPGSPAVGAFTRAWGEDVLDQVLELADDAYRAGVTAADIEAALPLVMTIRQVLDDGAAVDAVKVVLPLAHYMDTQRPLTQTKGNIDIAVMCLKTGLDHHLVFNHAPGQARLCDVTLYRLPAPAVTPTSHATIAPANLDLAQLPTPRSLITAEEDHPHG